MHSYRLSSVRKKICNGASKRFCQCVGKDKRSKNVGSNNRNNKDSHLQLKEETKAELSKKLIDLYTEKK